MQLPLLLDREGELTSELRLAPGGFGLGQIPLTKTPDATTTTVCGFCSTGCGLNVHLRENQAVGLTPATGSAAKSDPSVYPSRTRAKIALMPPRSGEELKEELETRQDSRIMRALETLR